MTDPHSAGVCQAAPARRIIDVQLAAAAGSTKGGGVVNADKDMGQDPPAWYWIFRYLYKRTRSPFREVKRPEEKLRKRLRMLVETAEKEELSNEEFWNVYAILGWYFDRASADVGLRGWSIDSNDRQSDEASWLAVRRRQADGSVVYDVSRAWIVVHCFARLHHCAVTWTRREAYIPEPFSRAEYQRLYREGRLNIDFRMAVERRLLIALGEASLYRAIVHLNRFSAVAPDETHSQPPYAASSPVSPVSRADPIPVEHPQLAYRRFRNWMSQATKNWSPSTAYPIRGQLRNPGEQTVSFYTPFRHVSVYGEWCFGAYSFFANQLFGASRRGNAEDTESWRRLESLKLMFGALDNLGQVFRDQLWTARLRKDDPAVETVVLESRGGLRYEKDRKDAYSQFFVPVRDAFRADSIALSETYRRIVNYLKAITLACDSADWYEVAGSFASQLLELEAALEQFGLTRRKKSPGRGAISEPGPVAVADDDAGTNLKPINLSEYSLRIIYSLCKGRGFLVPACIESIYADRTRDGREEPSVGGDEAGSLAEVLPQMFPYTALSDSESPLEKQLREAARVLRRPDVYPDATALLLRFHMDLLEEWLRRRNLEAISQLLRVLRSTAPRRYASILNVNLCTRIASALLRSFQHPGYIDTARRSLWQQTLSQLCADIPLADWRHNWSQQFITLSALMNLGLTVVRLADMQDNQRPGADALHQRLLGHPGEERPTILDTRHRYPAQLLSRGQRSVETDNIRDLMDTYSRQTSGTPCALVLMAAPGNGSTIRLQVFGSAHGRPDFVHIVEDVPFTPCRSSYDGVPLQAWPALMEDATLKGGEWRAIFNAQGFLHDRLPWDGYAGNFTRLGAAITEALAHVRGMSMQGQEERPTPVILMPSTELTSQPWQLLLNRYTGDRVDTHRMMRYLVTLCPSVGWWSASLVTNADRVARHTQGIYLRLTDETLPDGNGGDYRASLCERFGAGAPVPGMALKADNDNPVFGASLEVILAHGTDDPSVPVMSRIELPTAGDPGQDSAGIDNLQILPRISLMLACHGANAGTARYDAISPVTLKLRHSKAAVGAVTVVPPQAALALGSVFAEELGKPGTTARCLDMYHRTILQDPSGCVQLFQLWGGNEVLIWRR